MLTFPSPSAIEASDDEHGEQPINVMLETECFAKVHMGMQFVKILGRRLNEIDDEFKILEDSPLRKMKKFQKSYRGASM